MLQDDKDMKRWVAGMEIPVPSADFERRILAAAALQPAPASKPAAGAGWLALFWPIRGPQLAFAASMVAAYILASGNGSSLPFIGGAANGQEDVLAEVQLVDDPLAEMDYALLF